MIGSQSIAWISSIHCKDESAVVEEIFLFLFLIELGVILFVEVLFKLIEVLIVQFSVGVKVGSHWIEQEFATTSFTITRTWHWATAFVVCIDVEQIVAYQSFSEIGVMQDVVIIVGAKQLLYPSI